MPNTNEVSDGRTQPAAGRDQLETGRRPFDRRLRARLGYRSQSPVHGSVRRSSAGSGLRPGVARNLAAGQHLRRVLQEAADVGRPLHLELQGVGRKRRIRIRLDVHRRIPRVLGRRLRRIRRMGRRMAEDPVRPLGAVVDLHIPRTGVREHAGLSRHHPVAARGTGASGLRNGRAARPRDLDPGLRPAIRREASDSPRSRFPRPVRSASGVSAWR